MPNGQLAGNGKTALVLAGGGLTGAVYEIGALRAIDDLLVDRTVNDFDIYVGTSAGALIGALLANGVSPEAMLQVFQGSHPAIRPVEPSDIFQIDKGALLRWTAGIPEKLRKIARYYTRHPRELSLFDLGWNLSATLPPGIYDPLALERYLREVLAAGAGANSFLDLPRHLDIIATDLDSGERVVFGPEHNPDVPISMAVAASAALPLLYAPVRIGDQVLVDGGMRGTASLDLAIEHGATLVVCINPLVPYDDKSEPALPFFSMEGGYLSKRGLQAVASQVSRITVHAGLHYHIKQLQRLHPEVDIIVIEPRPDDCQMFYNNIMRYAVRLELARHGFESVTLNLAEDYNHYKQVLARHGIPLSRRLVIDELAVIRESGYDPEVIRQILEKRSPICRSGDPEDAVCRLNRVLADLELTLDDMAGDAGTLAAADVTQAVDNRLAELAAHDIGPLA